MLCTGSTADEPSGRILARRRRGEVFDLNAVTLGDTLAEYVVNHHWCVDSTQYRPLQVD